MMAELDKKGDLPLALLRDLEKKGSGNLPATPQSRSKAPQDFRYKFPSLVFLPLPFPPVAARVTHF